MNFDQAFADLLGNEGGYTNNPADPGGETNWGITAATARANGYAGPMRDMDQATAKAIYARQYWLPAFDQLPYLVAFQVFDAGVNHGVTQAVRWLQRAVGTADDGKIGPVTLQAAKAADPTKTVLRFNAARLKFYTQLPTWGAFGKGWARRIVTNLEKCG